MDPYYSHYRKYKAKYLALCQQEKEMQRQQQQQQYGGYDEDQLERYYKYKAKKYRKKYKDLVGGMMFVGRHGTHEVQMVLQQQQQQMQTIVLDTFRTFVNVVPPSGKGTDLGLITQYGKSDVPEGIVQLTMDPSNGRGYFIMDFGSSDAKEYLFDSGKENKIESSQIQTDSAVEAELYPKNLDKTKIKAKINNLIEAGKTKLKVTDETRADSPPRFYIRVGSIWNGDTYNDSKTVLTEVDKDLRTSDTFYGGLIFENAEKDLISRIAKTMTHDEFRIKPFGETITLYVGRDLNSLCIGGPLSYLNLSPYGSACHELNKKRQKEGQHPLGGRNCSNDSRMFDYLEMFEWDRSSWYYKCFKSLAGSPLYAKNLLASLRKEDSYIVFGPTGGNPTISIVEIGTSGIHIVNKYEFHRNDERQTEDNRGNPVLDLEKSRT